MADSEECWELYYWPLAGRGEFVRVIFEEAGVAYKENNDAELLTSMFKQAKDTGWPCFAPPMIKRGDFKLCQTPVICKYLGKKFGLYPEGEVNEVKAEQINASIHDFIGEGRLAFHGKDFVASYYGQAEETKPYIKKFVETRLPWLLKYFERVLVANKGGDGFVIGDKLTYVDLGLMHVLRATASQFAEEWASYTDFPKLKAFKERMEARPKLAAYFKSERCRPFEGNSMM
eukprot:gene4677-5287_t